MKWRLWAYPLAILCLFVGSAAAPTWFIVLPILLLYEIGRLFFLLYKAILDRNKSKLERDHKKLLAEQKKIRLLDEMIGLRRSNYEWYFPSIPVPTPPGSPEPTPPTKEEEFERYKAEMDARLRLVAQLPITDDEKDIIKSRIQREFMTAVGRLI